MAEDLDQLKYDARELKDLLSNNKGEAKAQLADLETLLKGIKQEVTHIGGDVAVINDIAIPQVFVQLERQRACLPPSPAYSDEEEVEQGRESSEASPFRI